MATRKPKSASAQPKYKTIKVLDDPRTPAQFAFEAAVQAVEDWKANNSLDSLKAAALKQLNSNTEHTVMTLLGMTNRYGRWEVDSSNNASAYSSIAKHIEKANQAAIQEWLTTLGPPSLDEKTKKACIKEAVESQRWKFQHRISELLGEYYKAEAQRVFDSMKTDGLLSDYQKTLQLLQATPTGFADQATDSDPT